MDSLTYQLAYEVSTAIRTLQTAIRHVERLSKGQRSLQPIEICLLLAGSLDRLKKAERNFQRATS